MFHKIIFPILLMMTFGEIIVAQSCVPAPVEDIDLSLDRKLSWSASSNCPSTDYMVRILQRNVIQYEYTVSELSLDVSFLTYCRSYIITINPVSDNIIGMDSSLERTIQLPEGVDISVVTFTESQIDGDLLLQWFINSTYSSCVKMYHLYLWNEDSDNPREFLLIGATSYYLQNATKCMRYQFGVQAYYSSTKGTLEMFNYTVPAATNSPSLLYINQDATTINTTWALENYSVNRCKVSAMHINSKLFNITRPIEDTPLRTTVDISLTGLRANSMYYFNVTVENEAGLSKPFQMAVQTLPIDPTSE